MKLNHMNARALGSVAVAAMAVCALSAHAAGDDVPPLSLKLSETVTYDSNYSRTTERRPEVTSSTGVEVGLNKPYGRQNYTGNAKFAVDRHKNVKEHDNQNYDVNLGFYSGIASRAAVSANAAASRNLNAIQNNQLNQRLAKNTRSYNAFGLDVQYGLTGRWVLIGSGDVSRTSYSLASAQYDNQNQKSVGLKGQYNTSDLLSFGLGLSFVKSEYPNKFVAGVAEETDQRNLSLSSNWQVTGFSSLVGVVSLTENKYKSDANAKFTGLTGRVNWNYTPSSITAYTLSASRGTDDDTASTGLRTGAADYDPNLTKVTENDLKPRDSTYKSITTSLNGTIRWTPTAKLGFNTGLSWYKYDISKKNTSAIAVTSGSSSSDYTVLSLGGDYQFSRAIFTGCSYQYFKQTGESNPDISYGNPRVRYQGSQIACSASFKID